MDRDNKLMIWWNNQTIEFRQHYRKLIGVEKGQGLPISKIIDIYNIHNPDDKIVFSPKLKYTIEQVRQDIATLITIKGDNEEAHALEDKMRNNFIVSVSLSHYSPAEAVLIAELLKGTNDIDFIRYMA